MSAVVVIGSGLVLTTSGTSDRKLHIVAPFVTRSGTHFSAGGSPFYFGGANDFWLPFESAAAADEELSVAASYGFRVIRTWGNADWYNPATTSPNAPPAGFHYWDGTMPTFNDTTTGLKQLDYVVYRASQMGLRLVIPFTDNWDGFGGMDSYVCWLHCTAANSTGSCSSKCFVGFHDDFYTNPTIRGWYVDYVDHLLNHVNTYNGLAYKDDPTIMAWDLANEPGCIGAGAAGPYPASPNCSGSVLWEWARDMSIHVKSVDRHHLVAVGDQGAYCLAGKCVDGDALAYIRLDAIDYMTYHMYPAEGIDYTTAGINVIDQHVSDAHKAGKPAVLEEFGLPLSVGDAARSSAYQKWAQEVYDKDGAGYTFWMLAGSVHPGDGPAPGHYIHCPGLLCSTLASQAQHFHHRQPGR